MGLLSDDQSMKRVPEIDVEREISNDSFVTKEEEVYCSSVMENGTYPVSYTHLTLPTILRV